MDAKKTEEANWLVRLLAVILITWTHPTKPRISRRSLTPFGPSIGSGIFVESLKIICDLEAKTVISTKFSITCRLYNPHKL